MRLSEEALIALLRETEVERRMRVEAFASMQWIAILLLDGQPLRARAKQGAPVCELCAVRRARHEVRRDGRVLGACTRCAIERREEGRDVSGSGVYGRRTA